MRAIALNLARAIDSAKVTVIGLVAAIIIVQATVTPHSGSLLQLISHSKNFDLNPWEAHSHSLLFQMLVMAIIIVKATVMP